MDINCIGCDTPIPHGSDTCPLCGAKVKKGSPAMVIETTTPKLMPAAVKQTEVHHHHHVIQDQPLLIEKTSKKWKAIQALGAGIMCLGVVSCVAGISSPDKSEFTAMFMAACFLIGLVLYIRGRVGAWWHHG
jgi:hypothetical protein